MKTLLLILLLAVPSFAQFTTPIATVGSNADAGGDTNTSDAIDTTGANFIVASVVFADDGTCTFSDSKSNTWSALTIQGPIGGGTTPVIRLYYVFNPTVGSGHTFTCDGMNSFNRIDVQAWADALTSPLDQEDGDYAAGTTLMLPSITPAGNNYLVIVAGGCDDTDATLSINGGFTITTQGGAAGDAWTGGIAYLVQTTAAAAAPTWTSNMACGSLPGAIASFKNDPDADAGIFIYQRYRRNAP